MGLIRLTWWPPGDPNSPSTKVIPPPLGWGRFPEIRQAAAAPKLGMTLAPPGRGGSPKLAVLGFGWGRGRRGSGTERKRGVPKSAGVSSGPGAFGVAELVTRRPQG